MLQVIIDGCVKSLKTVIANEVKQSLPVYVPEKTRLPRRFAPRNDPNSKTFYESIMNCMKEISKLFEAWCLLF